jgi:hypothetical protein
MPKDVLAWIRRTFALSPASRKIICSAPVVVAARQCWPAMVMPSAGRRTFGTWLGNWTSGAVGRYCFRTGSSSHFIAPEAGGDASVFMPVMIGR